MRQLLALSLIGAALLAGAAFLAVKKEQLGGAAKIKPEKTLKAEFRGIPKGTKLEWDNGKYVPESVPGYESKADYPDDFWIYDEKSLADKTR